MKGAFEQVEQEYRPREANLAFIKEMYSRGAPLENEDITVLLQQGEIQESEAEKGRQRKVETIIADALDRYVLNIEEYYVRCEKEGFTKQWEGRDILHGDWVCEEPAQFDDGFVAFIDSHYIRFCDLIAYEPFWLYMEQSRRWMLDEEPDLETLDEYERMAWYKQEFDRISVNVLYALDRYGWYKESSLPGGEGKYIATLAMSFLLFQFDTIRSQYIGKGRQITSTTTLSAAVDVRMITRRNFHAKLIACDLDTTQEIFEDKVKYAFGRFADWMKPKVDNDNDGLFRVSFNSSQRKGSRKAMSSKVSVVAPKLSAINGGAPDVVLVDEAPFLDIFHGMVMEGRPVMFTTINGKLVMKRQLLAWGTGGRSSKGGGSFEREHRGLFSKWQARDFSEGIVPIFLDWTCRPNITVEFYKQQRIAYMAGNIDGHNDTSIEERDILFRQHYPSSIDDMYSIGGSTIVPMSFIIKNADKVSKLPHHLRPVYGELQPVYDTSVKNPLGSFLPYQIKGVQFVVSGEHDVNAPVTMFMQPRKGENLYYQYTDPIMSGKGYSRHASAIRDAELRTIPCIVNCRYDDPYKAYVQSKLMGMYYANDGQTYCPELVENNIGVAYIKWLQGHEWNATRSLITKFMLPDFLQGGGDDIGIDTKAGRKAIIVELGKSDLIANGTNYYIPQLWSQLRFFTGTTAKNGNTTWQVDDYKKHQDDVVDVIFGSVISRLCFANRVPRTFKEGAKKEVLAATGYELVYDRQAGAVRRVPADQVDRYKKVERNGKVD